MIKEYNLDKQGLDFKSDFNWNFSTAKAQQSPAGLESMLELMLRCL